MTIEELKMKMVELHEKAQAIQDKADDENRDLSDNETVEFDAIFAEMDKTQKSIARAERLELSARSMPVTQRQTTPQAPKASRIEVVDDGRWGWPTLGEFAAAVRTAALPGGQRLMDQRLIANAPTTYGTEAVGTDGGFAVPPQYSSEIVQLLQSEQSLLNLTDQQTTTSNSMSYPVDETSDWQTTGGIQAYWESEAGQMTQSKPSLKLLTTYANKVIALVPVTDELLEDAPALDRYLKRKAPAKILFKVNHAILQGTGAGQPLGILNSGALVSVAKKTGQAADTVEFENINSMWSRLYAPCRMNAVWLINQDIEPELDAMTVAVGTGGAPVYLPPGGLSDTPYARLKGRPVIPTQACETLGDQGDIILADLSQYLTIQKVGGIKSSMSVDLWFDYDLAAYKFVLRIGGQPWWSSAISARDGSNTLSPFVTLDERA